MHVLQGFSQTMKHLLLIEHCIEDSMEKWLLTIVECFVQFCSIVASKCFSIQCTECAAMQLKNSHHGCTVLLLVCQSMPWNLKSVKCVCSVLRWRRTPLRKDNSLLAKFQVFRGLKPTLLSLVLGNQRAKVLLSSFKPWQSLTRSLILLKLHR